MRFVAGILQEMSSILPSRARRGLIFFGALLLVLFALTTDAAARNGHYADAAAGAVLLGLAAATCAVAWSAARRR